MDNPVVETVVPAFNAASTIGAALASLQTQTLRAQRIVVVDDGSTDGTAEIVAARAAVDPRVILVSQRNGGVVAAASRGLAECRAPFMARLDADDIADPDRLERQVRALEADERAVAVGGGHREIASDGTATGNLHMPDPGAAPDCAWAPAREPQFIHSFTTFRREAVLAVGGYRELPVSEDSDLFWRLGEVGRLIVLDGVFGSYRMHPESISASSMRSVRRMAACSQLVALSAARRRRGRTDIARPALGEWNRPVSLAEFVALAARGAEPAERDWLAVATAAKTMELAGYRPVELETADCRFIRDALAADVALPPGNRHDLGKMLAATAARLVRLGRVGDARLLAGPRLWPQVALRAGTNRLYWRKHLA